MVVLGLWLATIGYGIAYAGWAKLGGDPSYSLADSFSGRAPAAKQSAPAGLTLSQKQQQQAAQQSSVIDQTPVLA